MNVMLAERAVEKLRAGREPLPAELEALEMGLRLARPAHQIIDGRLPRTPTLDLAPEQRAGVEAVLPAVGLIGWVGRMGFATGFLVSPRVLATNLHVADYITSHGQALSSGHILVWFDDGDQPQWDTDAGIPIGSVLGTHPTEDFALLELARAAPVQAAVRLVHNPALAVGDRVIVVGYPLFDGRNPYCIDALFENLYSVKRASPGEITDVRGMRFDHDCSTLSGSSGSPVIDCRTGQVIGIHSSGQFAYRNTALSTEAAHAEPELRRRISGWI